MRKVSDFEEIVKNLDAAVCTAIDSSIVFTPEDLTRTLDRLWRERTIDTARPQDNA